MKVYHNINDLPAFSNAVITIGTFDGVHNGHLQIISQLIKEAESINGTPVLITFFPHPKQVVSSKKEALFLINTPEEKYSLLKQHGILHIVEVPFNKAFAEQTATQYIEDFLVKIFHPHTIIIGYDHRFGNNREGDYQLLEKEAIRFGFKVKEIPEHVLANVTISSTRIRSALLQGDINTAADLLGYPYFFSGLVVQGNQLGRTIGYPTANLQMNDANKLVPANGVYAIRVNIEGNKTTFKGMMNIGIRPTVEGGNRLIEVNIFDFNDMIYGNTIQVTLLKLLRQEIKFASLDDLKAQLALDKAEASALHNI
ncbi:MAG: bifunctional riboflavin kinase/FAD synthetase [Ferruginibacter sp.]